MLRAWLLLGALLGGLLPAAALGGEGEGAAAPGSWQASAAALSVARSDRRSCSEPFTAPPLARGRQLASIAWRFRVESRAAAPLRAWLCQGAQCVALPGSHGRTAGLKGLDAGQPLQLCFQPVQPGPAQRVSGLQLLVEYR